jgi:hypothetical protein
MNARILTTAAVTALFCGVLPGRAADPTMLNLLMPDAKIISGVNVQQAAVSPFGLYVLSLLAPQDQQVQQFSSLLGFDPRRDVTELLMGSPGPVAGASAHAGGLVLARGNFAISTIMAMAQQKGAATEVYKGVTILEDPKQMQGLAFLDANGGSTATLLAAGSVAQVKGAIHRLTAPSSLDAKLITQVQDLSAKQDAWVVSTAPLAGLTPPAGAPQIQGMPSTAALQNIQQFWGGVKFGSNVAITGVAVADTAQNASALAGIMQFAANMMQAQSAQNPQAAGLLRSLSIAAQNNTVNVTMSLPMDQVQQMMRPGTNAARRTPRPAQAAPSGAQKKM